MIDRRPAAPHLATLAWRSLRTHRVRTAITTLAVAIGVALIAAGLTIVGGLETNLEQAALRLTGRADLTVRAFGEASFSPDEIAAAGRLPGVVGLAPQSEQRVFYRTTVDRGFLRVIGVRADGLGTGLDPRLSAGSFPRDTDSPAIALPEAWAAARRVGVGNTIDVMTRVGLIPFTIVGLVKLPGPVLLESDPIGIASLNATERYFVEGGRPTQVALRLAPGTDPEAVIDRLPDALERDFVPLTATAIRDGSTRSIAAFRGLFVFSGAIALFVGAFLIHNTLAMAVREQRRDFGLLRAAGALPGQIIRLVVRQGLAIGLVGSAIGALAGLIGAHWLAGDLIAGVEEAAWFARPAAGALGVAIAAGLAIAIGASLAPALAVARLSPVEALRRADPREATEGVSGPALGIALGLTLIAGAVLVATGLSPAGRADWVASIRLAAALGLLVGVGSLVPAIVGPLGATGARLLAPAFGVSARLAGVNLVRARGRTGLTIGAFLISVALVTGLATIGASAVTAGQAWAAASLPGDLIVVSPVVQPDALTARFSELGEVRSVARLRRFEVVSDGRPLAAIAIEWPERREFTLPLDAGRPEVAAEALRIGRGALISAQLARAIGAGPGESLQLETANGPAALPIVGLLRHPLPSSDNLGPVVVGWPALGERFGRDGFEWLAIEADPAARNEIARRAEELGLGLTTVADLREAVRDRLSLTLGLFAVLVGCSALVATLGVVNTMLMNVTERRHEIAVLRAVGMTRGQVIALIVLEAGLMGLAGGAIGLVVGLCLAWVGTSAGAGADVDLSLTIDGAALGFTLIGAIAAATIAAIEPARRAAGIAVARGVARD